METYQSINGCDSIVTYRFDFVSTIETNLFRDICEGDSEIINGEVYDENNRSGMTQFQSINGCDSIVFVEVAILQNSLITNNNESFCEGDSVLVNNAWVTTAGILMDTLQNILGCDSIIETMVEMIPCDINLGFNLGDVECFGEANGFIEFNVESNNYPLSYEIIGITATGPIEDSDIISINDLLAGDYVLLINDPNGDILRSESFTIIEPDEIEIQIDEIDPLICNQSPEASLMANAIGGTGILNYNWSNGENSAFINGLSDGTFSVTVEDANSCSNESSVTLTYPEQITFELSRVNITCGETNSGIVIVENISGGTGPYEVSINGGNFDNTQSFENLPIGNYAIVVKDANGCTLSESTSIIQESSQSINNIGPFTINEGDEVLLELDLNFVPQTIEWSPSESLDCSDCETVIASPSTTTTYNTTITDDAGCIIETSVLVTVIPRPEETEDIYIPNTFCPSGSGVNSVFKPMTADGINSNPMSLKIYDRWGNLVFEENGIDLVGWNGTYDNKDLNHSVYIYVLEYISNDETIKRTGEITLIR